MPTFVDAKQIHGLNQNISEGVSAHTTYGISQPITYQNKRIIFKKNKHNDPDATRKEVAFGSVANCVMQPNLAPPTYIVTDKGNVQGVAAEYAQHSIVKYAPLNKNKFSKLVEQDNIIVAESVRTKTALDIPFEFLQDKPHGFFAKLMADHHAGKLTVDMSSLASVLTTSHFLEEDDLHKGNIGYFVVQGKKDPKPRVVFFKIDHDLMFMNSIMSYSDSRVANFAYTDNAFQITSRDLERLPDIEYSGHYWPTKRPFIVPIGEDSKKAYIDKSEVAAFAALKYDADFQQEKWKCMLKQALMPLSLIQSSVAKNLDLTKEEDRDVYEQTINAFAKRRGQLRTTLLTSEQFKEYMGGKGLADYPNILTELRENAKNVGFIDELSCETDREFVKLLTSCRQVAESDTELHVLIRTADYRLKESSQKFKAQLNVANSRDERPLDLAYMNICEIERRVRETDQKINSGSAIQRHSTLLTSVSPCSIRVT